MPSIRVAVVSDLHCHGLGEYGERQESALVAGAPRSPASQHPAQALLDLVDHEGLGSDLLICPGDLANKVSAVGFDAGWHELRGLRDALKARDLVATLGNHDVSSRARGGDPFQLARNSHKDFPLPAGRSRDSFWTQGFAVYSTCQGTADVVVLNTAYHHFSEEEARRGTFPDERIEALEAFLAGLPNPGIRIAVMHHHPILHSFPGSPSVDVLANGDRLVSCLAAAGCIFIMHGHRHQPRLSKLSVAGRDLLVLAAGSFSVNLGAALSSVTRNLFHLLELQADRDQRPFGTIRTWEFRWGQGWKPASPESAGFPHIAGFGPASAADIRAKISAKLASTEEKWLSIEELARDVPELAQLTPDELAGVVESVEAASPHLFKRDSLGSIVGVGRIHTPSEEG